MMSRSPPPPPASRSRSPGPVFTPPRTKSSAETKICICDWGEACPELKTFFRQHPSHPYCGKAIDFTISKSCDYLNFRLVVARYFHLSTADEEKLLGNNVRFRIARHHFPIPLLQHFSSMGALFRLAPLSKEVLDNTGCYQSIDPPPQRDLIFRYDPNLGSGVSQRAAKRMNGEPHFRVVPCVSRVEATSIAAHLQHQGPATTTAGDDGNVVAPAEAEAVLTSAAAGVAPQEPTAFDHDAPAPAPPEEEEAEDDDDAKKPSSSTFSFPLPKRVARTSLAFRSDVDAPSRPTHPRGILHATKLTAHVYPPSSSSSPTIQREEHAFAWIADNADDPSVVGAVVSHLGEYGFRPSHMRFVPYSSKANWIARYPHAAPYIDCDGRGELSGSMPPRWEDPPPGLVGNGVSRSGRTPPKGGRRAPPPKLLSGGLLADAERDELHLAVHEYLAWLRDELTEMMEATDDDGVVGRRLRASGAGVNIHSLGGLVAKMEGTFRTVRLEKARREREEKGKAAEEAVRIEEEMVAEGGGGGAVRAAPPQDDDGTTRTAGAPPREREEARKRPKTVPFLERALEAELRRVVDDKRPRRSKSSKRRDGAERASRRNQRDVWEERLEELRSFRERNGRFPRNSEGRIGEWLKTQRKLFSRGNARFMKERCARLEDLGVPLRQRYFTNASWNDRIQQLVEFGRVNGHFNVPNADYSEALAAGDDHAGEARRFQKYVQRIRTEYRAYQRGEPVALLTEERIAQLQDIGFEFPGGSGRVRRKDAEVPELDWSTRMHQMEAFLGEMGHLRVDPNYSMNSNLGGFAVKMSELHRSWQEGRENLSPDMVEKLNQLGSLGFRFDVFKSRWGERSWEDHFALLLEYRQRTGSCRVPHHYKADFRLGSWVARQRKEYKLMVAGKPSRMTHESVQRLESVGFEWVARRGE